MADFSKQYCDKYDPGFPHDFDYEELAKDLKPGFYQPAICEGFGSAGIAREDDGTIVLVFINYDDPEAEPKWMMIDQVTDKTHREIWKK